MPEWSVRRIQRLIDLTGASTYLEIGVQRGRTFLEVKADRCIAVDPAFLFDTSQHAAPGANFTRCPPTTTSGRFHVRPASMSCSSIGCTPSSRPTATSAMPSAVRLSTPCTSSTTCGRPTCTARSIPTTTPCASARSARARARAAGWATCTRSPSRFTTSTSPSTTALSINDGNGQTLVWHASGVTRTPVFDSLETISRLSWFEMRDRAAMMQVSTEKEAFAALCVDLGLPYVAGG